MRFQATQASCGPAALRNALMARGLTRSEEELETLSGCTPVLGTSPRGLLRAISAVSADLPGLAPSVISEARADVALLKLVVALEMYAVILCVDSDSHWVTAFGRLGPLVHVADSAHPELVVHLTRDEVMTRWRGLGRKPYYGIVI